jgi:hypothetical protein
VVLVRWGKVMLILNISNNEWLLKNIWNWQLVRWWEITFTISGMLKWIWSLLNLDISFGLQQIFGYWWFLIEFWDLVHFLLVIDFVNQSVCSGNTCVDTSDCWINCSWCFSMNCIIFLCSRSLNINWSWRDNILEWLLLSSLSIDIGEYDWFKLFLLFDFVSLSLVLSKDVSLFLWYNIEEFVLLLFPHLVLLLRE